MSIGFQQAKAVSHYFGESHYHSQHDLRPNLMRTFQQKPEVSLQYHIKPQSIVVLNSVINSSAVRAKGLSSAPSGKQGSMTGRQETIERELAV